jgi:hypothetical protein
MDSAEVRLEAGRTLKNLTCSTDGRDEVAEKVSDGAVVVKMVRALLAISGKHSSLRFAQTVLVYGYLASI